MKLKAWVGEYFDYGKVRKSPSWMAGNQIEYVYKSCFRLTDGRALGLEINSEYVENTVNPDETRKTCEREFLVKENASCYLPRSSA